MRMTKAERSARDMAAILSGDYINQSVSLYLLMGSDRSKICNWLVRLDRYGLPMGKWVLIDKYLNGKLL